MVREMIRRGRRHVVYLAVRLDARTLQRQQGYTRAMEEQGLTPVTLRSEQRSSFSVGATLLQRILIEAPDTDAIFCTNDDVAIGAFYECQRQGIEVPGQMAIAGFHGHDVGQVMVPTLASVITPREQVGQRAAEALIARLSGATMDQRVIDLGYRIECGGTL